MRRIQFVEIHEQAWLPAFLRDAITDSLQFGLNLFKAYAAIAPRLQDAVDATGSQSIIDLCSGGGGPWMQLSRRVHSSACRLQIWLTDKYPNTGAVRNVPEDSKSEVSFYPAPVNAMKVPRELRGLRTMFTSFHHFPPDEAGAILQNAADAREGICIFEITRRHPFTIVLMLAWVFVLCVGAPWIRPFRWSRLFWTYLIPIIPFILFFDGVVSCLRTYRPQELRRMVDNLRVTDYKWEIGEEARGKLPITYLIGLRAR